MGVQRTYCYKKCIKKSCLLLRNHLTIHSCIHYLASLVIKTYAQSPRMHGCIMDEYIMDRAISNERIMDEVVCYPFRGGNGNEIAILISIVISIILLLISISLYFRLIYFFIGIALTLMISVFCIISIVLFVNSIISLISSIVPFTNSIVPFVCNFLLLPQQY